MMIPTLATEDTYSIVADSAYPSLREVVSAFPHNMRGITRDQRVFNRHLSSKRQVGGTEIHFTHSNTIIFCTAEHLSHLF